MKAEHVNNEIINLEKFRQFLLNIIAASTIYQEFLLKNFFANKC